MHSKTHKIHLSNSQQNKYSTSINFTNKILYFPINFKIKVISPITTFLKLHITTLIILTEPTPPFPHKLIRLIIPIMHLITHLLSIPHQHIIINLHPLGIQENRCQPIWQPLRGIHFMKECLVETTLCLDVLDEDYFEEMGFQEDVYETWAHLDYG